MPITRINTFEAQPGHGNDLREFLSSVIDLIMAAPGCHSVELLVSHEDNHRLAIVETWDSIESHKRAAMRIPPDMMQKAMSLFASPASGVYYDSVSKKKA